MKNFDDAFAFVVGAEGGFGDDRHDRGNWTTGIIGEGECRGTKYGISAMAYPSVDIPNLTLDEAKLIYRGDYWKPIHGDYVAYAKALCMFDCGVNQGIRRAARFAQQTACVTTDGIIGMQTIGALNRMKDALFIDLFLGLREKHYRSLKTFDRYGKGWLNRLEHVRAEAGTF